MLFFSLVAAALCFLPQAFVSTPLELGILRFLVGIASAGLVPSINALIRQYTPSDYLGRIYGLNQSAQFIGISSGSFLGGTLAGFTGIAGVFLVPGILLLLCALWFYIIAHRAEKIM